MNSESVEGLIDTVSKNFDEFADGELMLTTLNLVIYQFLKELLRH